VGRGTVRRRCASTRLCSSSSWLGIDEDREHSSSSNHQNSRQRCRDHDHGQQGKGLPSLLSDHAGAGWIDVWDLLTPHQSQFLKKLKGGREAEVHPSLGKIVENQAVFWKDLVTVPLSLTLLQLALPLLLLVLLLSSLSWFYSAQEQCGSLFC
jgi:hypothetical protein